MENDSIEVSIILPYYNAERWLDECLQSVLDQTFRGNVELSAYNDASTDNGAQIIELHREKLKSKNIHLTHGGHNSPKPKGVGFAKNCAVRQSRGTYLCFLDSDDVMLQDRIELQLERAKAEEYKTILGTQFIRHPPNSTERFTKWANELTTPQLYSQIYTSHGPTLIMPTWFCNRRVFEDVDGFSESGNGTPEDLIFYLKHIGQGGNLCRIDKVLLVYRYHPEATTFSVKEETIWDIRMQAIQESIISGWSAFTIWNAGKQGRRFYRSLSEENRKKVKAFCDVSEKKISKGFYTYEDSKIVPKPKVPILHFTKATKPLIICVKKDLTGGVFEDNLASLNLTEGLDYYHFN